MQKTRLGSWGSNDRFTSTNVSERPLRPTPVSALAAYMTDLRRPSENHPIHVLLIRNRQPTRHRRRTVETLSWRIERLILIAEHRDSSIPTPDHQHRRVNTQWQGSNR